MVKDIKITLKSNPDVNSLDLSYEGEITLEQAGNIIQYIASLKEMESRLMKANSKK